MAVPPRPDNEYVDTLRRAHLDARHLCLTLEKLFALYECRANGLRYRAATDLRDALYTDWQEALTRSGQTAADTWDGWLPDGSGHIPPKGGRGMWGRGKRRPTG